MRKIMHCVFVEKAVLAELTKDKANGSSDFEQVYWKADSLVASNARFSTSTMSTGYPKLSSISDNITLRA
jgi:hypothetical protein